jgi:tetratricopeptide (TPR) repeat protein
MSDGLREAQQLVERGDWVAVLDALEQVDDADLAEALELRAQAAYAVGEFERSVEAWEQLHELLSGAGDQVGAARAAAMVAMFLMIDTGLMAPVRGWLRRAERELEGIVSTPAHAVIAMTRAYERFMCGDLAAAQEHARLAVELGTTTDVIPAVVVGRTALARIRIYSGDVAGGLAELEEVGALLMSGAADALTCGMMYCEVICAAQGLGMHDMASEWTVVMDRWRREAAFGGLGGRCRVHRAELLRISGPCDTAEEEALAACDELRPWMRREFGWPLAELGNIRLRRGDLAGAEAAFVEAHQHAWSPQPGLALVRLELGDGATAAMMIADAIDHPLDVPSKERPPIGELRLAPLLDAQAEIAFALNDPTTARRASERLDEIAESYPGTFIRSWADLARARIELLEGNHDAAAAAANRAIQNWTDVGAPYEASTARLVLASALAGAGRSEAAERERRAAEHALREFGAHRRAEQAAGAATASGRSDHAAEAATGRVVGFRSDGSTRTITYGGTTSAVRDLKGLRYVARLVSEPGREFHVLDLVAVEAGVLRVGATDDELHAGGHAGLPVLDAAAKASYRRRLADIEDDIEDARQANDPGRIELAERDREYLIAELKRAIGLGGRDRTVGGSAERARTSVARAIRYGLDQMSTVEPELAAHLRRAIRTGTYCSYEVDPTSPLTWET